MNSFNPNNLLNRINMNYKKKPSRTVYMPNDDDYNNGPHQISDIYAQPSLTNSMRRRKKEKAIGKGPELPPKLVYFKSKDVIKLITDIKKNINEPLQKSIDTELRKLVEEINNSIKKINSNEKDEFTKEELIELIKSYKDSSNELMNDVFDIILPYTIRSPDIIMSSINNLE